MQNKKQKLLNKLKFFYLFVFALSALLIAPTHLFPQPYFMPFRFPHYLEKMGPFLGFSWPMTFEIYHYVLYALIIIVTLNILGIIFYPKFKRTAIISSLVGLFLIPLMILFFFFKFINVNASTVVIYGIYSVALLIVDILTFKTLLKREKAA